MAKNEPNKPDNVTYIDPGNKEPAPDQPLEAGGEAPAPEMTTGESAALANEGEEGLRDKGEEQPPPPAPLDIGGEHIPGPGDTCEKVKAAEPDKAPAPPAPEEKSPEPDKPSRRGRSPKAEKADKPEKAPKAEKTPKADKPGKQKRVADKGGGGGSAQTSPAKEEAPPAPEQPPAPRDATRNGGTEQIVYLNLSELHTFKNHPFGVRDDAEMKALVESVKSGGVKGEANVNEDIDIYQR